ncbi:unnamed protein product [Ixodes pacificus]
MGRKFCACLPACACRCTRACSVSVSVRWCNSSPGALPAFKWPSPASRPTSKRSTGSAVSCSPTTPASPRCSSARCSSSTSCASARPSWSSSGRSPCSRTTWTSWTTPGRWSRIWWTSTWPPRGRTTSPGAPGRQMQPPSEDRQMKIYLFMFQGL